MAQLNSLLVTGNSRFINPINGDARNGVYYVKGTQTASTGAWTGVIPIPALYDGLTIMYYLPYAGSGNATLNLTLSTGATTGAINCYYSTSRLTTHYGKGSNIVMTYHPAGSISVDGTATTDNRWIANANYTDGNNTAYNVRNYYNSFVAGSNKIFPYTIIMQNSDGRWESIVTSSSTGTSKARNTHGFRLGQIALMYANATYNENATIGDNTIYEEKSDLIDHRYSFNTANNSTSGTTAVKPVYLVGAINASDGLFYLDTTWWTQTLPTTADGKLYIYLGDAYDYYRMTFRIHHPVYCYTNGKVREFTQDSATVTGHTVAKDVPSNAVFTDNNTTYTFANGTNGFTVTPSGGTAQTVTVTPSITNNVTGSGTSGKVPKFTGANTIGNGYSVDTTVTSGSANLVTSGAVYTAIDNLPEPMVFKGSLGTGGTITALPVNGTASIGDTYKVITAGTYASKTAKVGDTFICLTKTSSANTWELIPSGDEPSGTVTSVTIKATSPIAIDSSSAITTSGTRTLSHANSGVTAGTYKSVTVNATGHVTGGTNPTTLSGYGITDALSSSTTYAGSSSVGGSATSAEKLSNTSKIGDTNKPVYFTANGVPATISYTIDKSVPSNAVFTDTNTKVTQTATSTSADYEVLFSETADNTTHTEGARKNSNLKFNPSTGNLQFNVLNGLNISSFTNNAGFHNSIYRGKSLGTSITSDQWVQISAGTFDDMYIGDYWTLSTTISGSTANRVYRIAAFDYWWNCGDSFPHSSTKHHIVLVPDASFYNATMNDTNITTGGYVGSKMYTTNLEPARTAMAALFGDHLYSVRRLFTTSVNSLGQATGWGWYTSTVDLMNENMVYGSSVWSTSGFETGVDRTILPLFALDPTKASIRADWWLRASASSALFACVNDRGYAGYYSASNSRGVRPAFAIF